MCQFIRDAHLATVEIPSLEIDIIDRIEEAKDYKTRVVSVNSAELIELIDKYNGIIIQKNNLEIEKRDNRVSIEKLYAKIRSHKNDLIDVSEKIELYEEKRELIKNMEKLFDLRNNVETQIGPTKTSISECLESINQHHRTIGS